jgi:hypothetical protein
MRSRAIPQRMPVSLRSSLARITSRLNAALCLKRLSLKFYKYMTLNKNTLDAFINEYCWYSSPLSFNDPFDCALMKGKKFKEFGRIIMGFV